MSKIGDNLTVTGHLTAGSMTLPDASVTNATVSSTAAIARSKLAQDTAQPFLIPIEAWRVWDAHQTALPNPSANDDLGIYTGTLGTNTPHIATSDLKAAGATTRYAAAIYQLPPEYDEEETITLRVRCGMLTTAADTSCTIDAEVYPFDGDTTAAADICATAAQSMNDTNFANKDFTITATGRAAGDRLHIRLAITCTDGATGTVVQPAIDSVQMLLDIRG